MSEYFKSWFYTIVGEWLGMTKDEWDIFRDMLGISISGVVLVVFFIFVFPAIYQWAKFTPMPPMV